MDSIEGFILVGGASSRMGKDKSRLRLEGQTFVERIAQALSPVTHRVTTVGKELHELELDLPSTPDLHEQWGALGGVHAALTACRSEWALIVACDLPFVTADLFRLLAEQREGFEAVAPVQSDGYPQPLCALYKVSACLRRSEGMIRAGERRPITLLQSVKTRWVSFAELFELQGAAEFFANINTPQDYALALQKRGDIGTQG